MDTSTLEVANNPSKGRFEVKLDDEKFGIINYRKEGNVYILVHTEVPPEYGGQGVAQKLIHDALELVKSEDAKIIPLCPFVRKYLLRHGEYASLVIEMPEED